MVAPNYPANVYYTNRDYKPNFNKEQEKFKAFSVKTRYSFYDYLYMIFFLSLSIYAAYYSLQFTKEKSILVRIFGVLFAFMTNWLFIISSMIVT